MRALFLLAIFMSIWSGPVLAHGDHLGSIHIDVGYQSSAMPHFEKGVKLLHSFQYDEARREFLQVQTDDPHFSLGYWGEAMTYNHPLWNEQDYDKAVFALSKFARTATERVNHAKSNKEKGL